MNYSEKLKHPKWQKKRLEILNRDNFTCQYCKDTETQLHVHHLEYFGNPWDIDSEKLITACVHCHELISLFKNMDIVSIKKIMSRDSDSIVRFFTTKDGQKYISFHPYTTLSISPDRQNEFKETIINFLNG